MQSDEVHSVRRLPHRCGYSVRAGGTAVRGKPDMDAQGNEERAGDPGPCSARRRDWIGGRGPDPDMVCAALTDSNRSQSEENPVLDQAGGEPSGRFFALIRSADRVKLPAADACTFARFGRSVELNPGRF